MFFYFFVSSRRRHTISYGDWSSDVCSSDLPRLARDPELLGVREELRARGPHVRVQHVVEPPGPPVHALRVVGALPAAPRPDELRERAREPDRAAARAPEPSESRGGLRMDRPHVPAPQAPRAVALLRVRRDRARLRDG